MNRTLEDRGRLQLFSAARQGLSVTAQSLFTLAMAARTPQDLRKNQHALQLCVVHLVGHTMQHDRYIAGIVVIHGQSSGHCVVYWPAAPHALVLSEYASLQLAHAELNRIGALAANVKRLARQVAPDWAFEAITHHPDAARKAGVLDQLIQTPLGFYIRGAWVVAEFIRSFKVKHLAPTALADEIEQVVQEQIASDPLNWLAIVATSQSDASALLYRAPVQDLQRQTQAACNSAKTLDKYRVRRLDQGSSVWRGAWSFFSPLSGFINQAYELLLAARRYHLSGDARDAVDVGFMAAFFIIDLLMNFLPGPKVKKPGVPVGFSVARLHAAFSRMPRLRLARPGSLHRLTSPSPIVRFKALERFRSG